MDITHITSLLGGIALFLYGMSIMGAGLEKLAGGKMQGVLQKLTSSTIKGVIFGTLITGVIQSSAGTVVICVGLVNSGIMTLTQSVGVIMGANIGTTVTGQLIRMADISGDSLWLTLMQPKTFAPVVAFIGCIFYVFLRNAKKKNIGQIMLGFGILFTGMSLMDTGVSPLRESAAFQNLFVTMTNPILGVLVGLALGWGTMNSVFLGVMLAMSSTMITMKSIEDLGLKKEPFANLAMGTLVIEDIIAIFAMVILSTIAVSQSISGFALAERIGLLLLYLALWLILGIYLVPTVMKKLVGLMNDEVLLVFSLGLCFLMAVLAEEIGLSTELGAFLAGSLLAGTVHAERVEHLVTPCKNLFGAVFFVSVGFMVQPAMIVQYILPILLLSVISIVGLPPTARMMSPDFMPALSAGGSSMGVTTVSWLFSIVISTPMP